MDAQSAQAWTDPGGEPTLDMGAAANSDPLLDRVQLAAYLGITERHARQLMEQRRIDIVAIGKVLRVRRSTAERLIAACTSPATRPVATDSLGREKWLRPAV